MNQKNNPMSILKNTTLLMPVRDEIMNPAGGIKRCLEAHLPYVEQAIVADTGSIDGTRQVLEEIQREYPNLRVIDIPWKGFAKARNRIIREASTEKLLFIDADELITNQEKNTAKAFQELADFVEQEEYEGYDFDFWHVPIPGESPGRVGENNPRLFLNNGVEYAGRVNEFLGEKLGTTKIPPAVYIAHFLPSTDAKLAKAWNWYGTKKYLKQSPSDSAKEHGWKEFNPRRNEFN